MTGTKRHLLPASVLALAVSLPILVAAGHAEEPAAPIQPVQANTATAPGAQTQPANAQARQGATGGGSASGSGQGANQGANQGPDQATISAGQAAFERSCTKCHDAARSLERTKDLAGWRATVRRMANKRDADIPQSDIEPIAQYLANRNNAGGGAAGSSAAGGGGGAAGGQGGGGASASSGNEAATMSTFATLSPQWRGGNNFTQNPGFGPLAWVGAGWQGKVVSARVTACIACHGVGEPGLIQRIEPVEVAVRIDVSSWLDCYCKGLKGNIDAGRFIVPFGAFSAQTDPSLYRTVTPPLIFNMGQRIFNQDLGFPVLPMPYVDEGINGNLAIPVCEFCVAGHTDKVTATLDGYLVNGLEGGGNGIDFFQSRDLFDNNNRVAGGGRFTIGDQYVRVGTSISAGRFDVPDTGSPGGMYYKIYGFDIQAKYKRLFRFQAEYARRDSDRTGLLPTGPGQFTESVYGYYVEAEGRPDEKCKVSLLVRYDFQRRSGPLPPSGITLPTGEFGVERFTVGVNIELWQQSLLMFNYERWILPEDDHRNEDVFGVRYTITF